MDHDTTNYKIIGLITEVTVREVNLHYRYLYLARQLQPDKLGLLVTGITSEEVVELFKLINDAQQFLQATMSR